MASVRTPLSCGHYYDGLHMGPDAWCVLCLDYAKVGDLVQEINNSGENKEFIVRNGPNS